MVWYGSSSCGAMSADAGSLAYLLEYSAYCALASATADWLDRYFAYAGVGSWLASHSTALALLIRSVSSADRGGSGSASIACRISA